MVGPILQAGTYPDNPINYWFDAIAGNNDIGFVDAIVYTFGDQMGVSVFMLMLFGTTFLVLYQATDSVMVPVGVLIVLAPIMMALLPAVGVQFVMIVVVLAITIVGVMAYKVL